MVTPLIDRDELDVGGLERLIEHILAGGVHGLFILGTTGEGPSLGYRLRRELIDRTCRQVAGRVPVLVGITDTAITESVALAAHAHDAGAMGLVLAPPYYFAPDQSELLGFIRQVADEVALPLFLYNMPSHTKVSIGVETVRRAIELPNVAGVKDSSGDMVYFHALHRVLRDRPDLSLLIGPEELLAEAMMLGAHGGVAGGSNLNPALFVALYDAATRGEWGNVADLHARVIESSAALYGLGQYGGGFLKALKCALQCAGLCRGAPAAPLSPLSADEHQRIARQIEALGPVPAGGPVTPAA